MSDVKYDGGPAFPTTPQMHGYSHDSPGSGTGCGPGMSLRDWFAGKAMQGFILDRDFPDEDQLAILVSSSYEVADAMLKARDQ